MGIIDPKLAAHSSPFLKGEQFEGQGINLKVAGFEVIKADDPEYGAKPNTDGTLPYLLAAGKLKEGETFKYSFKTVVDPKDAESVEEDRVFESASPGFFIAFSNLNPDVGDVINIRREGKTSKTRYFITKV
jgi:hypothetical protein